MTNEEKALETAQEVLRLLSDRQARLGEGLQTIRGRLFRLKGCLEAGGCTRAALPWIEEALEIVTSLQQQQSATDSLEV